MQEKLQMRIPAFLLVLLLLSASSPATAQSTTKIRLTQSQTKALVQAVQDEIYDREYQGYFFPEGGPVGDVISDSRTRVSLYVDPVVDDGEGEVVYKLMPYGEVLRLFHVHKDGTIVLDGDPELGFPASQPNRKTVYMEDRAVDRIKREWLKSSFEIDLSPRSETLQDAIRRQKERTGGFSAWEFSRSKENKQPQ
jgi:hypothetical protein